jgi:hypothetical protein
VAALLEHVDLLDFPGYRGRLRVTSLGEVRAQVEREDADPVVQLLLRGKVAYLFERYTDDQEMSMLIMCTRCDHPIEIADLAPVLDTWVHATQGNTPAERAARRPGLAWVLTQFDHRLTPKPNLTESQQRTELNTMIKVTLLDRFAQCEWLGEWTPGQPFNNVFLVRKPGFLSGVLQTTGDVRRALPAQHADRLARGRARCSSMRTTSSATSPTPARRGTRCSSRTTAAWNAWPPISTRRSTSAPSWRASPSRCSA